jgi:hypothetical protein
LQRIVAAVFLSETLFVGLVRGILVEPSYPRAVYVLEALLLISLMSGVRLASRSYAGLGQLTPSRRALVLGAGDVAEVVVRAMKTGVLGDYEAIGLVSCRSDEVGLRIHGVPVLGSADRLRHVVESTAPDEILLALDQQDDSVLFPETLIKGFGKPIRHGLSLVANGAHPVSLPPPEAVAVAVGKRRPNEDRHRRGRTAAIRQEWSAQCSNPPPAS